MKGQVLIPHHVYCCDVTHTVVPYNSEQILQVKVKLSLYRAWRLFGLQEVEAPTFSDIRLIDGAKIVSPTRRPFFNPRKIPGTHFR
jgi:hypothetical protein